MIGIARKFSAISKTWGQMTIWSGISLRRQACLGGAILALGGLMGGCAFTASPVLRVADARIVEQSETSSMVEFDMEATNDGADPLPLREVVYTLDAGGERMFKGARSPEVTVPANGQIRFVLPVSLPFALDAQPLPYVLRGSVTFVAPGPLADAMFDNGVRRPSVTFTDTGTLVGIIDN